MVKDYAVVEGESERENSFALLLPSTHLLYLSNKMHTVRTVSLGTMLLTTIL